MFSPRTFCFNYFSICGACRSDYGVFFILYFVFAWDRNAHGAHGSELFMYEKGTRLMLAMGSGKANWLQIKMCILLFCGRCGNIIILCIYLRGSTENGAQMESHMKCYDRWLKGLISIDLPCRNCRIYVFGKCSCSLKQIALGSPQSFLKGFTNNIENIFCLTCLSTKHVI